MNKIQGPDSRIFFKQTEVNVVKRGKEMPEKLEVTSLSIFGFFSVGIIHSWSLPFHRSSSRLDGAASETVLRAPDVRSVLRDVRLHQELRRDGVRTAHDTVDATDVGRQHRRRDVQRLRVGVDVIDQTVSEALDRRLCQTGRKIGKILDVLAYVVVRYHAESDERSVDGAENVQTLNVRTEQSNGDVFEADAIEGNVTNRGSPGTSRKGPHDVRQSHEVSVVDRV